ncbi:MAG: hypothetical protein NUV98_05135, partial [Candidatus Roizmanbacteria bacterium]|nr:hypothetical protein [Candidatus Roizmanbacteria bacterium]
YFFVVVLAVFVMLLAGCTITSPEAAAAPATGSVEVLPVPPAQAQPVASANDAANALAQLAAQSKVPMQQSLATLGEGVAKTGQPTSQDLGGNRYWHQITIMDGFTLLNVACSPCPKGFEVNFLIEYHGPNLVIERPEGHAWWWSSNTPSNDLWREAARDSLNDAWGTYLPSWLANVPGVVILTPPAELQLMVVASEDAVPNVPGASFEAPVAEPTEGEVGHASSEPTVVAQGENFSVVLKPEMCYHLNMWWSGDSHEYDYLVCPLQEVTLTGNGTVEEFNGLPQRSRLPEDDDKHVFEDNLDRLPEGIRASLRQYDIESLEPISSAAMDEPTVAMGNTAGLESVEADLEYNCAPNNVLAQSEPDHYTLTTACQWVGVYFYTQDQPEKLALFYSPESMQISNFTGTVVAWDHQPTQEEMGNKPFATLNEVQLAGIELQGDWQIVVFQHVAPNA